MSTATTPHRVPVEERLFSLVLALLATERGLTKNEILSTVQGYSQRYFPGGDNANLERQFERDKDDIRELGVPLETFETPDQAGNNQNLKYRIPRDTYELPEDITFSAEETALLGLASMVWSEGSLSGESRRAMLKLKGLGIEPGEPVLSYTPRVRVREESFEPLNRALDKHQIVRFSYLKPGEVDASVRTVAPLALLQFQGRWHCYAVEPDTNERKTFLLRRIVSGIVTTGGTIPPPTDVTTKGTADGTAETAAERGLRELQEVWQAHVAQLVVVPGSDAATRLAKRRGAKRAPDDSLQLHYVDLNIFADELAGYGPELVVVAPEELRIAVRDRLRSTAAAHADTNAGLSDG